MDYPAILPASLFVSVHFEVFFFIMKRKKIIQSCLSSRSDGELLSRMACLTLNLYTAHDLLSYYKGEKCLIIADDAVDDMRDLSEPSQTWPNLFS